MPGPLGDLKRVSGDVFQSTDLGSDTLCRHNFEHNTMDGASSIVPA